MTRRRQTLSCHMGQLPRRRRLASAMAASLFSATSAAVMGLPLPRNASAVPRDTIARWRTLARRSRRAERAYVAGRDHAALVPLSRSSRSCLPGRARLLKRLRGQNHAARYVRAAPLRPMGGAGRGDAAGPPGTCILTVPKQPKIHELAASQADERSGCGSRQRDRYWLCPIELSVISDAQIP